MAKKRTPRRAPRRVTKKATKKTAKKASKKKTTRKTTRKTKTSSGSAWAALMITDLHVKAETLERVLRCLERTREEAIQRECMNVIMLGDWWDARNILSVRHVHALMDELQTWKMIGLKLTIIPGNHDQVSMNGLIHGVRIFDPFDNVTIAHNPIHDDTKQIAILPWREDPEAQAQLFAEVPDGWTVFGHAEAPGAMSNNGKKMPGRFKLSDLRRVRACYLGHFHKRQQIEDHCWYIGNPYEKDFGEMGEPKGIAFVTSEMLEPEWIPFNDMPRHHRLTYPGDAKKFKQTREQDVVEVYASAADMETAAYEKAIKKITAKDVRRIPIPDPKTAVVPEFALGIEEAIEEYARSPEARGDFFNEDDISTLTEIGKEILAQAPDAGTIVPLAKHVTPISVTVHNFCAIRGSVHLDLQERGALLLQGEMGVGKTSICDAMTWALYDRTSPRKPGASGAALRADAVIHDEADEAQVEFALLLDSEHEVTITRTKRRGKGSKITIDWDEELAVWPDGIDDQQALVERIIGMPYELWRACIYLGQGAVGNFVLDADKRRKELLSNALQLGACAHVQKLIRKWLKALREEMAPVEQQLHTERSTLNTLESFDFAAEMAAWDTRRAETIKAQEQVIADAQARVAQLDEKLATQAQWEESEKQHTEHVERLEASLTATSVPERAGKLHAQIGAAQAEKSIAERDLGTLMKSYTALQSGPASCPECGQSIPVATHEQHLMDIEEKIQAKRQDISSFESKIANQQSKLGQLTMEGGADVSEIKRQLGEARETLKKVRTGIDALRRIRAEREELAKGWERALETIKTERAQANPFEAKQRDKEANIAAVKEKIGTLTEKIEGMKRRQQILGFWDDGFGPKGIPVLVLRTVLYELETHANRFLANLTAGRVYGQLEMLGDDLKINFFKFEVSGQPAVERSFLQLSGGERRCVEMAFSPFALSEMIFSRIGVRVPMLVIDELTTHLSPKAKPEVCAILRDLGRDTVVVIDHDLSVQGEFDIVYEVTKEADGSVGMRKV